MLRRSLVLRQSLRESIQTDLAARTQVHQARIAAVQSGQRAVAASAEVAAGAAAPGKPLAPLVASERAAQTVQPVPLVLLAHGDSWFDYPLNGNDVSLTNTGVIAHLETMGTVNPLIQNVSHYGDATTAEMSWPKQQRLIDSLQDPANWLSEGKPDAILFSGGGDDIAGDQFCIFLDYFGPGATGLNVGRFTGVLDMVEASFRDLFAFRDKYAAGVPVFAHDYDFPIPNGKHPLCAGPWLQPSLHYAGWNDVAQGAAILKDALQRFQAMLAGLAADAANNFVLVETQGVLEASDWANELHPFAEGFGKIAQKYVEALRGRFAGRI